MITKYKLFLDSKGRNINDMIKERNLDLNITEIVATYEGLTSIYGAEKLHNLKILRVYNNNLTNINGIEKLYKLELLDIYNNNLTNLEGIENLTKLKDIYISNNNLTNIEDIKRSYNLETLYIDNNNLTSLEGIEHLTELKKIDVSNNPLIYSSTDLETIKKEIKQEKYNYKVIEEVIRKDYMYKTKDDREFKPVKLEKPFVITDKGERISILDIYPLPQDTYTEI